MAMCKFKIGDPVTQINSTFGVGTVCGQSIRFNGEEHYPVRFGHETRKIAESQLSLHTEGESIEELISAAIYSGPGKLAYELTLSRLNRDFKNTLYSYAASRTEMYPFQYKPLLKFLDSPRKRLLIADEVGLGKTIEAGYILQEERARKHMSRVLIICPSTLRYKWQREMSDRFSIHFDILNSATARKSIPFIPENRNVDDFYGIVSHETLGREKTLKTIQDSDPNLDLLIVDEVHKCKNPNAKRTKSVARITEYSEAVVYLSATPIQTSDKNLYVLMNMLLPEDFHDLQRFRYQLETNKNIVQAESLIRHGTARSILSASDSLKDLSNTFVGQQIVDNPFYDLVLDQLDELEPNDPTSLIRVIEDLDQLNMFSHVLTRTQKREVNLNRPERRAHSCVATPTEYETEIYDKLTDCLYDIYETEHGANIAHFVTVNMYKHIASSLPATVIRYKKRIEEDNWDVASHENDEYVFQDDEQSLQNHVVFRDDKFERIIRNIDLKRLRKEDTKYRELLQIINRNEKYIVFSFYVDTLSYLEERLTKDGIQCIRIDGSVQSTPDCPDTDERRKRIDKFREDQTVTVMLSSQVGSEGLDFQFCDTIVNWDIPWNPMVVEQRIGRIDRIGQESDRLLIFNLVMKDTVEEKILKRLYTRIGIFENSIGSLEPILGEVIHELEHELLSRRLTTEEENRRIGDALLVIERQKRDLDRLEKESEALVGHDQVFEEKMERVKTLGRYISSNELEEFVVRALPKVVKNAYLEDPQTDSSGIRTRKLPYTSTLESKLLLHNGKCDQDTKRFINIMSSGVTLSFGGEHLGNCSQGVEVLHAAHPLIRMLLAGLDSKNQFSSYTLTASKVKCSDLKNSLYFFVWGIIEETGPFAGRSVIGVLCDVSGDEASILESPDAAEIMLHSLLRHGERYPEFQEPDPGKAEDLFKLCVDELYKRKKSSQNHQQNRVDAMLNRRIAAVQSSCNYRIDNLLERLQTQTNEKIIRLYEGEIRNKKAHLKAKLEEYEGQRTFIMNLDIRGAGFVEIL